MDLTRVERLLARTKKVREEEPVDEIDPEIRPVVDEIRQWNKRLHEINKKAKKVKDEEDYSDVLTSLREAKEKLYNYMVENEISKIETYRIGWCQPPRIKTEERNNVKKKLLIETVADVIPGVSEEQLESIIEKLTI